MIERLPDAIDLNGETLHLFITRAVGEWIVSYSPVIDAGENYFSIGTGRIFERGNTLSGCVEEMLKRPIFCTTKTEITKLTNKRKGGKLSNDELLPTNKTSL